MSVNNTTAFPEWGSPEYYNYLQPLGTVEKSSWDILEAVKDAWVVADDIMARKEAMAGDDEDYWGVDED